MTIERDVIRAINRARPGSEQEGQAFDSLVREGFEDIPLTKDVSVREPKEEFIYRHSSFTYYPERSEQIVMRDGSKIVLTYTENRVMEKLARNAGRVVEFREFEDIWSGEKHVSYPLKKYVQAMVIAYTMN